MKQKTVWLILICCFVVQPAFANERVAVGDGRVSFIPPTGFHPLSNKEIAKKFIRGNPPQYVYASDDSSTSVAVTFSKSSVAPGQMSEFREAMESMLPRLIPGLEWLTREFVEIGGRKWFHFEMTSYAIDTDIHNHIYGTSFDGKALLFAFNSTVEKYPKMKASLEKSAQSIKLSE